MQLSALSKAEGIEAYMYEDKLEDADADEDGALIFEEFLGSYARWAQFRITISLDPLAFPCCSCNWDWVTEWACRMQGTSWVVFVVAFFLRSSSAS